MEAARSVIGPMLDEAWHAMGANRLRAFLTMLGMMIGVAAVIMMLAIGQGAQFVVDQSIASMGSNLFIVLSGSSTSGGVRLGTGAAPTLTTADAEAIAELPSIAGVAPVSPGPRTDRLRRRTTGPRSVTGTTPGYPRRARLDRRVGDIRSRTPMCAPQTRVALLGQTVVKNLFGDEDPVGKTLRIRQSPFVVIGVLAPQGPEPGRPRSGRHRVRSP